MATAADNEAELTGFLVEHGITFVAPALAVFAALGVEKVSDLDTVVKNDIATCNLPVVQQRKLSEAVVQQKRLAGGGCCGGCSNISCTCCCASSKRHTKRLCCLLTTCEESCNFCGLCKQCNWICGTNIDPQALPVSTPLGQLALALDNEDLGKFKKVMEDQPREMQMQLFQQVPDDAVPITVSNNFPGTCKDSIFSCCCLVGEEGSSTRSQCNFAWWFFVRFVPLFGGFIFLAVSTIGEYKRDAQRAARWAASCDDDDGYSYRYSYYNRCTTPDHFLIVLGVVGILVAIFEFISWFNIGGNHYWGPLFKWPATAVTAHQLGNVGGNGGGETLGAHAKRLAMGELAKLEMFLTQGEVRRQMGLVTVSTLSGESVDVQVDLPPSGGLAAGDPQQGGQFSAALYLELAKAVVAGIPAFVDCRVEDIVFPSPPMQVAAVNVSANDNGPSRFTVFATTTTVNGSSGSSMPSGHVGGGGGSSGYADGPDSVASVDYPMYGMGAGGDHAYNGMYMDIIAPNPDGVPVVTTAASAAYMDLAPNSGDAAQKSSVDV